jgi:hypothetical protein
VAIVQISQITNRKGLQVDLPQLAGAELGWSIDTRRLYIGNGTLEEGAPIIGNTEILTEFSDILEFQTTYTYKGDAAGYTVQTGPTAGNPITQSLQTWMDQFATVKDFGAVGDGSTDDTDAINRALYQLFCREVNPQIRGSLFFPAGVYRVTGTILIPPYATLWGEGVAGSVIQLDDGVLSVVASTADSLQQSGANIGSNGAIPPQDITITNMGFRTLNATTDIFLVEDANNCRFQNVGFYGPLMQADLDTDAADIACVRFASTPSLTCTQIVFDGCQFGGTTYGFNTTTIGDTNDQPVSGVTISNSNFNTLYQAIVIGTATPPVTGSITGFRIMGNLFDNIYAEGILIGTSSLNATGHNIFYGVGNHFGPTIAPYTAIINIQSSNNVSISDLFERPDAYADTETPGVSYPRVLLNGTTSIATVNGTQLSVGTYQRQSGVQATLLASQSQTTLFTVDNTIFKTFSMNYTITRDDTYRNGTLVTSNTPASWNDEFTENNTTRIILEVFQSGPSTSIRYSSSAGTDGVINYSITTLY